MFLQICNPIAYGGGFLSHTTILLAATLKPLKLWLPNFVTSCFYLFATIQSHKTQGFCVADFATLSDETRSRSKIFPLFIWIKEPCVRKFERLERSKLLGISQTKFEKILAKSIIQGGCYSHFLKRGHEKLET